MAVVPIPEGVERDDEEPTDDYGAVKNSGGDVPGGAGTGLGIDAEIVQ